MGFHGALNTMFVLRKFPHLFKGISRKGKKFSRIYVNSDFPITIHLGKLGQEGVEKNSWFQCVYMYIIIFLYLGKFLRDGMGCSTISVNF